MKRFLILLMIFFTTDSFASGIASNTASAPCTNNTLETYSGNSNLAADWQPNTIQLRWYDNNTLMDVQASANTCTYDGTLTIPSTAPTRIGYTFDGWTVKPEMDFATITLSPYETYSIGTPYVDNPYGQENSNSCMYTVGMVSRVYRNCANNNYRDLQLYEWKAIEYSNTTKTIYGASKVSAKSGNNNNDAWDNASSNWRATYNELESASGTKQYCWCQLTGYKPNSDAAVYAPSNSLPWIFVGNYKETGCAMFCGAKFRDYSTLRNLMLGITQ